MATIELLQDARCKHGQVRRLHPACFINGVAKPKWYLKDGRHLDIGFLDIETTGRDATFGTMLSWAIADYNSGKVAYAVTDRKHILSSGEDRHLVEGLTLEALRYPYVCTYWGTGFDLPFWRTRAFEHKLKFPAFGSIFHHDLYYVSRNKLRMTRNRLDNVQELLRLRYHKTHLNPRIWRRAGQGQTAALKYVLRHNVVDVRILRDAFKRLEPVINPTRKSI